MFITKSKAMKTLIPVFLSFFLINSSYSQLVTPCETWLTDFIQVDPKMDDGNSIAKYITAHLHSDTSMLSSATCMVGLRVSVNCKGEFSYEKQDYRNKSSLSSQCANLLQRTENIMGGIKTLLPGTIHCEKKDFVFKVVVKVKHNGDAVAEVLY